MKEQMTNYIATKIQLANNIRKARLSRAMTQREVARALNIERSTYAYYETGKTSPDIFTLIKISNLFHIDVINILMT